ncbi:hypothetical protein [Wolbachia endosymbiont (group A) of Ennomos erosarius]|uniref:hypothetical protein n=1 Tax=Wolbachia endosymbiont (group A) of Ennomos erosarius TaxID=3066174 RepID=UPI00333F9F70
MLANLIKFLDPSVKHWDDALLMGQNHNVRTVVCLGTGMTGEGGYLDDTLLVDSNHNVRTVMCFDTGILN